GVGGGRGSGVHGAPAGGGSGGGLERQVEGEGGAVAGVGDEVQTAAVGLHEAADDGEAEAGAALALGGEVGLEDVGEHVGGDAFALVAHADGDEGREGLVGGRGDEELAAVVGGVGGGDLV